VKTVGIVMLFGLCSLIGIRLGAKKTTRLKTIRSFRNDLGVFLERIGSINSALPEIATALTGPLSSILRRYLDLLHAGNNETEAAEGAAAILKECGSIRDEVQMFVNGLSTAARCDLIKRTETLMPILLRAETEAEQDAKQARVLRISGVLTGAGLAILLM
jgi:hypothetical protein